MPEGDPSAYLAMLPEIKDLLVSLNEKLSSSTDTSMPAKTTAPPTAPAVKGEDDTDGKKAPESEAKTPQDDVPVLDKSALIKEIKKELLEELKKESKVVSTPRPQMGHEVVKSNAEAKTLLQDKELALKIAKGEVKMDWGQIFDIQKERKAEAFEKMNN